MSYVLIGALARVIRGTNELTDGVDVCPSLTDFNRERLGEALDDLEAQRADRRRLVLEDALANERVIRLRTPLGELKLVPEPAGTRRGYNDLRRAATLEHIGDGLRPEVASVADLARMSAALAHELANERGREAERARERANRITVAEEWRAAVAILALAAASCEGDDSGTTPTTTGAPLTTITLAPH